MGLLSAIFTLLLILLPLLEAEFVIPPLPTSVTNDLNGPGSINRTATTDFAVRLFKGITEDSRKTENLVMSPVSVYLSLAMLNAGANHETAKQIEAVLNFQRIGNLKNTNAFNMAIQHFMKSMNTKNQSLLISNKIWQQKYFCFSYCRKFSEKLLRYFLSELGQVNFAKNPQKARETINQWVSSNTNGKITELIPPSILTSDTRFVLTNVVYFQNAWKHPFVPHYTHSARFNVFKDGKSTQKHVPTMYTKERFRVSLGLGKSYRLVELPYKSGEFSMMIVMPHQASGLKDLERSLTAAVLQRMTVEIKQHPARLTEVFLPKFTLSYGLQLNNALKGLGIKDVFDPVKADLSKINGIRGMYVSTVSHKAFIKVNEFGTEASGATGIVTDDYNLDFVRINRPFLFFILHELTGTVVFLGRVIDPTQ